MQLWRQCGVHAPHCAQVARLVVELYQQIHFPEKPDTKAFSPAGPEELLEYAGLLHDIGYTVDASAHHKHSRDVIRAADLPGLLPVEQEIIAQIARFHRRKLPTQSMKSLAGLSGDEFLLVRNLAAVLRVADGLDRSQRAVVQSVDVQQTPAGVDISFVAAGPADLEVWAAQKKSDLLEKVLKHSVVIRVSGKKMRLHDPI